MRLRFGPWLALALCAGLAAGAGPVRALEEDEGLGFELTPPRLAYIDGDVSFWRSGAEAWTPARVNTALAAGDELYAAEEASLELQVGPRAFVRAGEETQLGLTALEPDFLQLRVGEGTVSLDLRSLKSGQSLEVGTPNAALHVERSGYYRIEVDAGTTTFTSRRGGQASVTPAGGEPVVIAASEEVVVTGTGAAQLESYAAPELDDWDRWNQARTDDQLDALSARYVPADVYGAYDLDHYGYWRVVPTYGAAWFPHRVHLGWVPYSTGRWMWDHGYGWTWVDDAPWGWAPFHYGRWVYVSGYWAWCPGPIVVRPYYAPALVAFYGSGDWALGVRFGRPYVGWVPLGWGEPLIPWWGPSHFRRHAHWAGWGGPRLVNQVAARPGVVYRADEIQRYQNAGVRSAMLEVERDRFGRRTGEDSPFRRATPGRLSPLQSRMDVAPDRTSLVPALGAAKRPPEAVRSRSVWLPPQRVRPGEVTKRAPFGTRSGIERAAPPSVPRYEPRHGTPPLPSRIEPGAGRTHQRPDVRTPTLRQPGAVPGLPGEPANRVYRGSPGRPAGPAVPAGPSGHGGAAPRGRSPGR
jgi:hypothetical protein